ncbi:Chitin deacetylase [Colletotrichum higginsianum]|uniref:Chitin deacetylase n=1 Tax=Colletotrichum higginsianum TaxID=80884 RepID=A0A4T0VCJ1_9PEZI|nr:Chitin deacetylase [Colletotrichum higginsianum]
MGNPSAYTCPADLPCCSVNGWCGSTGDYCLTSNGCQAGFGTCEQDGNPPTGSSDDGNSGTGLCGPDNGNVSCATNECCSAAGYCGTTPDHCKAPDCLFQFGPACDANKIPPGLNTSSIVRTKLGQVEYGGPGVYSCVNPGDVALTYDDGPASYTNDLLDLLKKYNAKATFMITGNNNAKGEIDDAAFPWVSTIKRMYADGHQIASHTWSHADLCKITSAQRRDEMYKLEMSISAKPATTDNFLVIGHDIHQQTVYNLTEYMLQKFQGKKMVTVGECLGDPRANWYRADARTTLG